MRRRMTKRKVQKSAPKALSLAMILSVALAFSASAEIPVERKAELRYVLAQDCGSCHGLTLRGGLGPALLPERLQGRTASDLAGVILDGVHGTPMPPWRPLMSEEEALWLVEVLKSGDMVK